MYTASKKNVSHLPVWSAVFICLLNQQFLFCQSDIDFRPLVRVVILLLRTSTADAVVVVVVVKRWFCLPLFCWCACCVSASLFHSCAACRSGCEPCGSLTSPWCWLQTRIADADFRRGCEEVLRGFACSVYWRKSITSTFQKYLAGTSLGSHRPSISWDETTNEKVNWTYEKALRDETDGRNAKRIRIESHRKYTWATSGRCMNETI